MHGSRRDVKAGYSHLVETQSGPWQEQGQARGKKAEGREERQEREEERGEATGNRRGK